MPRSKRRAGLKKPTLPRKPRFISVVPAVQFGDEYLAGPLSRVGLTANDNDLVIWTAGAIHGLTLSVSNSAAVVLAWEMGINCRTNIDLVVDYDITPPITSDWLLAVEVCAAICGLVYSDSAIQAVAPPLLHPAPVWTNRLAEAIALADPHHLPSWMKVWALTHIDIAVP